MSNPKFKLSLLGVLILTMLGQATAAKAYVGLFKDNAVGVFDSSTNKLLLTIPIPAGPHGMGISPDGKFVYVASEGSSLVSVIDTATDKIIKSLEVGATPHGVAVSKDGKRLFVAVNGANKVVVIDTASYAIVGSIALNKPHTIDLSPDGLTAVVAIQDPGHFALVTLDVANGAVARSTPLENAPRDVTFSADGKLVYFTQSGVDTVGIFEVASGKTSGKIASGDAPHILLFTPNGEYSLVVSQGLEELDIFSPNNASVATIKVGKQPHWVAVSGDSKTAFVTNEGAGTVSAISLEDKKVIATFPVGNGPRKIVVQPN